MSAPAPAPAVGGAPALAGGLATAPPAGGPQTPSIGSEDRPVRTVSLRARVVLAVLILLTVVLVLLGVVVTTMLGNSLREDLRQRLQDRAGYAVVLQQQGVTGQTLADQMSGGGMSSSFAAGGVEFVGRADADPLGPPGGPAAGTPPGSAPPLPQPAAEPAVLFSESDGLLTAEVTLPDGILRLQAGENDIDRTLSALRTIEVVAGVAALLVTGLLLIRLVAVALRPLDRMASLARRIGAGTRGRRLHPTRPGTDLGRTATAFDEMLDALETAETTAQQAQERMRQFLADASHDLRTPLAGVVAGSDALLRADFDRLDRADREQRLVAIVRQARQAARIVDDLLVMARVDGALHSETRLPTVNLVGVLGQQLDALALRNPHLRSELHSDAPLVGVRMDPDELRRSIANLLENAARASPPAGQVTVTIATGASSTGGDMVIMTVLDDGPGVPADQRERIFERFVRLSADRGGEGSGLGLPIARAFARRAGGDVVCGSRPDRRSGAAFELSLPCAAPLGSVRGDAVAADVGQVVVRAVG